MRPGIGGVRDPRLAVVDTQGGTGWSVVNNFPETVGVVSNCSQVELFLVELFNTKILQSLSKPSPCGWFEVL